MANPVLLKGSLKSISVCLHFPIDSLLRVPSFESILSQMRLIPLFEGFHSPKRSSRQKPNARKYSSLDSSEAINRDQSRNKSQDAQKTLTLTADEDALGISHSTFTSSENQNTTGQNDIPKTGTKGQNKKQTLSQYI